MLCTRLRRQTLAAVLAGMLAGPAAACSYDGLAVDLSLSHPASLGVALAAQQAYQDGSLVRPLPLPGGFGMRRTLALLEQLRQRLPADAGEFQLLLVEPGLWSRFAKQGVQIHATPQEGAALVVLSEGALIALEKGRLSADAALQQGVLSLQGADQAALARLWRSAYPGSVRG